MRKKLFYNTITPLLLSVLKKLMVAKEFEAFRLVGDTALSLHRGHRKSVDIDLFTDANYGNKSPKEWTDVLKDTVLTTVLLDRILYRCEIIKLSGKSYRMENRKTIFDTFLISENSTSLFSKITAYLLSGNSSLFILSQISLKQYPYSFLVVIDTFRQNN